MSLHIAKHFSLPLALASATLVIHIGAATAADSTGNIQHRAKELLAATPTAHYAQQSALRDAKVTSPTPDGQELARQLLLGTSDSHVRGVETTKHFEVAGVTGETQPPQRRVAYGDGQAAAQQLLLGQHHASDVLQSGLGGGKVTGPTPDGQELARQLLLGTSGSRVRGVEAAKHFEVAEATGKTQPQKPPVAYGDARTVAR